MSGNLHTPFKAVPMGGTTLPPYSTDGLVLWLDAIHPRRKAPAPNSSDVWEDLSGNGYDVTFSAPVAMQGSTCLDITGISGMSAMPLNENYVVEVVTCPATLNLMWIYGTDESGSYPGHSGGALAITENSISRGNARESNYKFAGLHEIVPAGRHASFYVGTTKSDLYINGINYKASVDVPWNVFGLNTVNYLLNARTGGSNATSPTYMFALRIYNRKLSAQERQLHWLLDKRRFHIT